jgi:hypothetical protein
LSALATVADIKLADFGRKELDLAEIEMPGLMAARAEFGPAQTLKGTVLFSFLCLSTCCGASSLPHDTLPRRAHCRLVAHDHPNGRVGRDVASLGRQCALVLVQHLFHPGPRRGGHCGPRHLGVCLEG